MHAFCLCECVVLVIIGLLVNFPFIQKCNKLLAYLIGGLKRHPLYTYAVNFKDLVCKKLFSKIKSFCLKPFIQLLSLYATTFIIDIKFLLALTL